MFLPARLWNLRSEDFLRAFEGPTQPFPYWRSGKTANFLVFKEESELSSLWQEFVLNLLCHGLCHPPFLCLPGPDPNHTEVRDRALPRSLLLHLSLPESQAHPPAAESPRLWKLSCVAAEQGKGEISTVEDQTGGILPAFDIILVHPWCRTRWRFHNVTTFLTVSTELTVWPRVGPYIWLN